jgi:hypothetical protein
VQIESFRDIQRQLKQGGLKFCGLSLVGYSCNYCNVPTIYDTYSAIEMGTCPQLSIVAMRDMDAIIASIVLYMHLEPFRSKKSIKSQKKWSSKSIHSN